MSDLYEPNLKLNWIEHLPSKQGVAGSSPAGVAIIQIFKYVMNFIVL